MSTEGKEDGFKNVKEWENSPFHKAYKQTIIERIIERHTGTVEEDYQIEFDYFYYKLSILRALLDSTQHMVSPTAEMKSILQESPLTADEFREILDILKFIRAKHPASKEELPDSLIEKGEEVIVNFDTIKLLIGEDDSSSELKH